MTVLELRDVSFSYSPDRPVLRGLSLAVQAGTVSAVLGPNGSGKSTLIEVCLGWKRPAHGAVLLCGRSLAGWTGAERGRRLSLVPQRENLRFEFTAADYVLLGRAPHLGPLQVPGREDMRRSRVALEAAGIGELADRPITTLSGGEYQLVLIARSLAQEPKILLLDEPASHLDPANRLRVTRLLRELARGGMTVLFTTHDPQAAAELADTIHLLVNGRFGMSGSPRETLTEARLAETYGVPCRVTWIEESPHLNWDQR